MVNHPPVRRFLLAAAAATLAAAGLAAAPASAQTAEILAADSPDAIPGSYIVVFEDEPKTAVVDAFGGQVEDVFDSADTVLASMSESEAERLAADPAVAYVEQNQTVTVDAVQTDPPSWGLDRIDQDALPLDAAYAYPNAGEGVTAYIIDTGIWAGTADFSGRTGTGFSAILPGLQGLDCNGHGTHVAGTVGGTEHGVAKAVTIVPVQVLNCLGSGTTAGVIDGVDWVTENAVKPAVANMSLGGGLSDALDAAVAASIDSGVTYAVAAGNETADACGVSPARTPGAITVAASTDADARADFSNFGPCVDLFAPGQDITSPYLFGTPMTLSGTSMASPHVAGAAALYLSAHPDATPAEVADALAAAAVPGAVGDVQGSPNLLLNVTA
ncbi:S8 family peptidase [Glycomyces albidus]|uniref:S8 family serine peptidase n=1 Tax=Glycomyces albidus TaxID=2656774 RepID=A0A6L5GA42_9ACTN|nr:S8 family peptidase [Glycomyces albidus]MQM26534.1 S8 family serine peptidase [Glycomyces albidus]